MIAKVNERLDTTHEHESISEEHGVRVAKVEAMQKEGIDPWPYRKQIDAHAQNIIDDFESKEGQEYTIAGRLLTIREHGKTVFATMQDESGQIQLYLKKDLVGENTFEFFSKSIDIGDIIWVKGNSFKTKVGEVTLRVSELALLSKCLHPLPEKFHGIADIETKYRQRYLDLIATQESRERFKQRSTIIRAMRNFLDDLGYSEVETPMLQVIPGGAAARPFITHHNTLDMDLYMRIAPELFLKRLVVGGYEKVYEINKNFRNEGISTKHNPEFTMLEFYTAHIDYKQAMEITESIIQSCAKSIGKNPSEIAYGQYILNFADSFARMTMREAVAKYAGCSEAELENIDAIAKKHTIEFDKTEDSWGKKLFCLFEKLVEDNLVQPTFITEFPIEVSPLSKRNPENESIADRFELFVAGMELSNGFNELNNPFDQAERFKQQVHAHASGDDEAHHYDADFVKSLEYGLPPTSGVGIGVDRLVMLLTNAPSIRDVILFPTMRVK